MSFLLKQTTPGVRSALRGRSGSFNETHLNTFTSVPHNSSLLRFWPVLCPCSAVNTLISFTKDGCLCCGLQVPTDSQALEVVSRYSFSKRTYLPTLGVMFTPEEAMNVALALRSLLPGPEQSQLTEDPRELLASARGASNLMGQSGTLQFIFREFCYFHELVRL